MIEIDKIYNADCLEGMQQIDDFSIDCIICDPPYEMLNKKNQNAQWDKSLPLDKLWDQFTRIIKDNGAILIFGNGMFTAQLMMSQPRLWRYNLIWDKCRTTGFFNAKRMPLRRHEDIVVFYKSLPTYHPQMTAGKPCHPRGKGKHKGTNNCYGADSGKRCYDQWIQDGKSVHLAEKFPTSIVSFKKEHGAKLYHPTQKPVALIQWLIRTFTDEGQIVLDNTIGSGTTAVAAIRERRHYVGFELDKGFFDIAQARIKEEINSQVKQ